MTNRHVCFVITGEFLTTQARNFVLEDEPGKAWRLLAEGLMGDGADQVTSDVLSGKRNLIGDSSQGVGVADADPTDTKDYVESARWLYAGRVKIKGRWCRPCADVITFGADDGRAATKDFGMPLYSAKSAMLEWSRRRVQFYCEPGEIALIVEREIGALRVDSAVIFEPCGEPPQWLTPATSAQSAIDEWFAAGRDLEIRGAGSRPSGEVETLIQSNDLSDAEADALRELADAAEAEQFAEELRQIAEKVREQAGDDVIPLTLLDGRVVQVPRAPFTIWALDRAPEMRAALAAIAWAPVSTSGIKMYNDSTHHTDWVLGAGLSLAESYTDNVNRPAWALAMDMQIEAVDRE